MFALIVWSRVHWLGGGKLAQDTQLFEFSLTLHISLETVKGIIYVPYELTLTVPQIMTVYLKYTGRI